MSSFNEDLRQRMSANKLQKAVPAPGTITLTPDDFGSTYTRRPSSPIVLGLRILSETETQAVLASAKEKAAEANLSSQEDYEREHDRQCMIEYVAKVLCSVNDISEAAEGFDRAIYDVPSALNPVAIRRIYDAAEKLVYDSSPLMVPATDDDIDELMVELQSGSISVLEKSDPNRGKRARKYLKLVLDELQSVQ